MGRVDEALITQFTDICHQQSQQIKARLRPYVNVIPIKGDVATYDGVGTVEAREILGRIQPVQFTDIEHYRRKITRRRFEVTIPVDSSDVRGMLTDPHSKYAQAIVMGIERRFDRLCLEAAFADVWVGREFDKKLTAVEDGVMTVDATSGLTYEKLLEIKQNFIDADVGNDMPEKFFLGIAGDEHTDMMNETKLISGDYSRQYVIDKGEIQNALGFDIVKYAGKAKKPMLKVDGSGNRECIAASTRGIVVGVSLAPKLSVDNRPDYYETDQIQMIVEMGAVRTEGCLVQKVKTTATV